MSSYDFLLKFDSVGFVTVNISIEIETPSGYETLHDEDFVYIDSYSSWDISIEYEFNEVGDYNVIFILKDQTGTEWYADCWWKIEKDFFDLWIEQEPVAYIGEIRPIDFYAKSYFDYSTYVNISIGIETPSGYETLYDKDFVDIVAYVL